MIIANSALRASLAICHLISNAARRGKFVNYNNKYLRDNNAAVHSADSDIF